LCSAITAPLSFPPAFALRFYPWHGSEASGQSSRGPARRLHARGPVLGSPSVPLCMQTWAGGSCRARHILPG
uniref:Uncharacterized protein n=1 Tax=Strigops habroptila TaxID=2489341 RepID=A0A672U8M6_STRHB